MIIAAPASKERLTEIRNGSLFHVSKSEHRDKIIKSAAPAGTMPNCTVEISAMQGWSVSPFRLLRDYSVLDHRADVTSTWGRYTYFFLGTPSSWAVKKNLGVLKAWGELGDDFTVYEVRGADVATADRLVFYRADDSVVVIRGGYTGPAHADPAP